MLDYLSRIKTETAEPLANVAAAEALWGSLPRNDPIAAQKTLSGELADLIALDRPNVHRLRAVLALDKHAQKLVDALIVNYSAEKRQLSLHETQSWQAAFELCRSFGRAHEQFLQSMRDDRQFKGWREHLPFVVLRLFQHRQIELMLRPFSDERLTRFSWKGLHEAYRLAQSRGVLHEPLAARRCHSPGKVETTLERKFIHVLLQDLVNRGQLPPYDAFYANQSLSRWCREVTLESPQVREAEQGFVVDLNSDAGLVRLTPESADTCLCLDMAPVLESISDEITWLRDAPGRPVEVSSLGRGRHLKLLRKLSVAFSPERPIIARRGERKPAAAMVEVAVGMSQILRKLSDKPAEPVVEAPRIMSNVEEITITAYGGYTEIPNGASPNGESTFAQWSPGTVNTAQRQWTMVDRSSSGCRLHGVMLRANQIMPGVPIVLREDPAAPWMLAVVRHVRRGLAGRRVEIGVEYLGNDPHRIVLAVPDSDTSPARPSGGEPPRFAALYLESAKHPVLPIKTLVLPVRGLVPGDRLSLRSRTVQYTIELSEPLEEQANFIWSPFKILERWVKDEPSSVGSMVETR